MCPHASALGISVSTCTDCYECFRGETNVNMIHCCHCCSWVKDGQRASIIQSHAVFFFSAELSCLGNQSSKTARVKGEGETYSPPPKRAEAWGVRDPRAVRLTGRIRVHVTLNYCQRITSRALSSYFPVIS